MAQIRAGKLRALATTGAKRSPMLPEVPTLAEAGLRGYEAGLWTAFVFPAGVPPAIVTRLGAELDRVMQDADVAAALLKQGVEVERGGPQVVAARIEGDIAKWRDVIAKAGIKAQ